MRKPTQSSGKLRSSGFVLKMIPFNAGSNFLRLFHKIKANNFPCRTFHFFLSPILPFSTLFITPTHIFFVRFITLKANNFLLRTFHTQKTFAFIVGTTLVFTLMGKNCEVYKISFCKKQALFRQHVGYPLFVVKAGDRRRSGAFLLPTVIYNCQKS